MEVLVEIIISALTIRTIWLVSNKNPNAPLMGLVTESGWFIWIVTYSHWGLLPLNIVLVLSYIRMYIKWNM